MKPFCLDEVAPFLPPSVLDLHTPVWSAATLRAVPVDRLLADAAMAFPDRAWGGA